MEGRDRRAARWRLRAGWRVACLAAATAVLAASCGSSGSSASGGSSPGGKPSGNVIVFAAASLTGAFDKIGTQFEKANPGVMVKFSYAGSSSNATQIRQGAPADVFASANTKNMTTVTSDKLASGTPKVFARNKLEIIVEAGNPTQITSLADLSKPGVKVAVCAPDVPCGAYAKEALAKAGVTIKPVSEETSASGVVTKVSLGEADAGIVYTTDVKAGGSKVAGVTIPASQNVVADYPIVRLRDAPNNSGASAFISYVLGPDGQKVLAAYGFTPAAP